MLFRSINSVIEKIKKQCPSEGAISILTITEKQFAHMQFLVGENKTDVINSDERYIEL